MTVDTLRADHLGGFGYPLDTSPFIDWLASEGVSFRRAYSQAAATAPSHASLFTSLYPIQHGVEANGRKLDPRYLTLAEALAAAGFRTAAFVSTNAHFKWGGLSQGFEICDEQPIVPSAPRRKHRRRYRPADETVDAALAWLEGIDPSDRLFLWLHLFDPHGRLRPPTAHREEIRRQALRLGEEELVARLESSHPRIRSSRNRNKILRYDAEIRFVDSELRRFFAAFRRPEANDLWVVTADHGQGLGSHGWLGHSKQVYNSQLHVPLIFYSSGGELAPSVVDRVLVEHVDIAPTLAEWIGIDFEPPQAEIQGESFVGVLRGKTASRQKRYSFGQSSRYPEPLRRQRRNYGPPKYALQDLSFKYILTSGAGEELFDLASDPFERRNLIGELRYREPRQRLEHELLDRLARLSTSIEADRVDPEVEERLRALGYLQ